MIKFVLLVLILGFLYIFFILNRNQTNLLKKTLIEYDSRRIDKNAYNNPNKKNWLKHKLIAHGGGSIEGKVYTNSVEAFEKNYKKGFRLFEIDFLLSSDGRLVSRHSWDDNYGQDFKKSELPLLYDEFMNKKYYSKFTPMDFQMLVKLMERYSDVFVIIDGKTHSADDTLILYKQIGKEIQENDRNILKRFIPQMFYESDLEIIREVGFNELLYVVGREDFTYQSIAEYCKNNNIKAVSLGKKITNKKFIDILKKHEILVYTYTLNKPREIRKYFKMGVHGFFSDFVSPEN